MGKLSRDNICSRLKENLKKRGQHILKSLEKNQDWLDFINDSKKRIGKKADSDYKKVKKVEDFKWMILNLIMII